LTRQAKKLNFGAAGRFFRIEAPQAIFFFFGAGGKIVFNIDTGATNFRMNFGAAGKFFTS
jgi:hypothetical protein